MLITKHSFTIKQQCFNPFMLKRFFYHNFLGQSISNRSVSDFYEFNANKVDPGQIIQL